MRETSTAVPQAQISRYPRPLPLRVLIGMWRAANDPKSEDVAFFGLMFIALASFACLMWLAEDIGAFGVEDASPWALAGALPWILSCLAAVAFFLVSTLRSAASLVTRHMPTE